MFNYKNKIPRLLNKVILQSKDKYLMFMHKKTKKIICPTGQPFQSKDPLAVNSSAFIPQIFECVLYARHCSRH